nr:procollagen lysine 2 oxoglutarate 5 dioxygenase [Hymenolepis microstoma]
MTAPLVNFLLFLTSVYAVQASNLHVIGIRGAIDDAVMRFERSLQVFNYKYTFADLSASGKVATEIPFADKVKALKELISAIDTDYILVLDSHSSLLLNTPYDFLIQADKVGADFLFIEKNKGTGKRMPDKDAIFAGMLSKTIKLKELLNTLPENASSEVLVEKFLLELSESNSKVIVDYGCVVFQSVGKDSEDHLKVRYDGDRGFVQNVHKDSVPIALIAGSDGKKHLNALSNYLARAWSPESGCQICEEKLDLSQLDESDYPLVQLSVLITDPTPFLDTFFERLANLTYPKNRIDLVTFCSVEEQKPIVDEFITKQSSHYHSVKEMKLPASSRPYDAFLELLSFCWQNAECNYLFYVEPTVQLDKKDTLEHLISSKRNAVAPMMTRYRKFWSTFWGALTEEGAYSRSDDYFDIVERRQEGLWNVPFIGGSILFSRWAVEQLKDNLEDSGFLLYDISNAAIHRNLFLYVDNREEFGHLTNPETYNTTHLHNDLWQIFDNPLDWEEKYIHPLYHKFANASITKEDMDQPCTDVFMLPLMSETFCKQLIEEVEHFRSLESGKEAAPINDIYMSQIDWESHWIQVLQKYIYPIQLKLWEGYSDKPTAGMSFVMRNTQGEKPHLKNRNEPSTYNIDMPLNSARVDYTGGGVRFPRYNCSLVDTHAGWPLIFPGRLTHIHEGIEIDDGIRYNFVTFVNP